MTYKHGDWYCKPESEAEAKEIVERAVASGVELYETVGAGVGRAYKWDFCGAWGALEGKTHTGDSGDGNSFSYATKYTIEQVREKFLLPGERVEPSQEWSGEGFPPVGTVCEAIYDKVWHRCEILKHKVNNLEMKVAACDFGFKLAWSADFRPIRSERERWVESAAVALHKDAVLTPDQASHAAVAIYDAIKSGDLKAPGVE